MVLFNEDNTKSYHTHISFVDVKLIYENLIIEGEYRHKKISVLNLNLNWIDNELLQTIKSLL